MTGKNFLSRNLEFSFAKNEHLAEIAVEISTVWPKRDDGQRVVSVCRPTCGRSLFSAFGSRDQCRSRWRAAQTAYRQRQFCQAQYGIMGDLWAGKLRTRICPGLLRSALRSLMVASRIGVRLFCRPTTRECLWALPVNPPLEPRSSTRNRTCQAANSARNLICWRSSIGNI